MNSMLVKCPRCSKVLLSINFEYKEIRILSLDGYARGRDICKCGFLREFLYDDNGLMRKGWKKYFDDNVNSIIVKQLQEYIKNKQALDNEFPGLSDKIEEFIKAVIRRKLESLT